MHCKKLPVCSDFSVQWFQCAVIPVCSDTSVQCYQCALELDLVISVQDRSLYNYARLKKSYEFRFKTINWSIITSLQIVTFSHPTVNHPRLEDVDKSGLHSGIHVALF